jgi:protein-S-isoprenylcysteine O-methyltransferase Ste14
MAGTVVIVVIGHLFVPSIPADATAKTDFVPGLIYYSVAFLIFLAALWFGLESKRFKGPPMGEEITKRRDALEASGA